MTSDVRDLFKKATKYEEGKPLQTYKLIYDTPSLELEQEYFWILDYMKEAFKGNVEKITDNFAASPGSGHFGEMGIRATRMQEEGMKILGTVNQLVKTILNLIYDLKEFEIRLKHYQDSKSNDKGTSEGGLLGLKQIWMDQVDIKKGRASINMMAAELGFTTLRDAFMIANSIEDINKNQLFNEQVKRILIPRLSDFLIWKDQSEKELKKRFEIERSYLKSEVQSLKLYSSWAIPYIKAAQQLKMKGFENDPAMVSFFNTAMFELTLLGKVEFKAGEEEVRIKKVPKYMLSNPSKRKYYTCFLITAKFRGTPQKVTQQHYSFGGKLELIFDSFVLNEDELAVFKAELENKNIEDSISFIEEGTAKSLEELKADIDKYIGEEVKEDKKEDKKEEWTPEDPFSVLIKGGIDGIKSIFEKKEEEKKKEEKPKKLEDVKEDNAYEEKIRKQAESGAISNLDKMYLIYKKAHRMPVLDVRD